VSRVTTPERGTHLTAGFQPDGKPCRNLVHHGQGNWLRQRFLGHRGSADMVRQDQAREKGIKVSLRAEESAVEQWRRELRNAPLAKVRLVQPPSWQIQRSVSGEHR
jgi:hypothetical protein